MRRISRKKIFFYLGASKNSIDLLPSPGVGTEWTKSLPTDEGRESDEIFEFDGANTAVAIPNDVLDHNLSSVFTVSAWLKHKHIPTQEKHVKEHVVCSADDHSKLISGFSRKPKDEIT